MRPRVWLFSTQTPQHLACIAQSQIDIAEHGRQHAPGLSTRVDSLQDASFFNTPMSNSVMELFAAPQPANVALVSEAHHVRPPVDRRTAACLCTAPSLVMWPLSAYVSEQPHIPKQKNDRGKKTQPHPPPNTRLLRHPQHPIHRAAYLQPRVLKLVVHPVGERARVADLVADGYGQLCWDRE